MKHPDHSHVISFAEEKSKRQVGNPTPEKTNDFLYEYNLLIKITRSNKIHAVFQTTDYPVSEEEQAMHLYKILEMLKKSNPELTF